MLRDEARKQIQDMLGHRSNLIDECERAFRFVQEELESEATLPWFLRKVDASLLTSISSAVLPKPADYIRLWHEDPIVLLVGTDNVRLVSGSTSALRARFSSGGYLAPQGYSEIGENFSLYPIPTAIYPVTFTYYAKEPVLATNIENKWLKYLSGLMIGRAGFIVASGIRDQAATQLFGAMAAAGTEKLNAMSTAQDEDGGKPIIGGED